MDPRDEEDDDRSCNQECGVGFDAIVKNGEFQAELGIEIEGTNQKAAFGKEESNAAL